MKNLLYCFIFSLFFQGTSCALEGQVTGAYMGVAWNSSFPVIEKRFPGVEFIEEDRFHVTRFQLMQPEKGVDRIEFKLFENQLISVLRYYKGSIDHLIREEYLSSLLSGLGQKKEVRKTTANSLAGIANVEIYEYPDILVLFRYYPPNQKKGLIEPENSIVIIYKLTFDKMVYYRKHSEGDMEEIVDYDYIEF